MLAFVHAVFAFLAGLGLARAESAPFDVQVTDATVAPGASGKVVVSLGIPPEFHVYRDMLEVKVLDAGGLTVGAPVYPPGEVVADPAAPGQTREQYVEYVAVDLPVKAPSTEGARFVRLAVRYQGCKKDLCYMPATTELTAKVTVAATSGGWLRLAPVMALLASPAMAQDPNQEVAVTFTPGPAKDDSVVVHVDMHGEWHLNKMFMSATLKDVEGITAGEPVLPPAHPSGSQEDGSYREDFVEDFDLVLPVSGAAGKKTVKVEVGYQACKGLQLCRMPTAEVVEVPLTLTGAALAAVAPPAEAAVAEAVVAPPAEAAVAPAAEAAVAAAAAPASEESDFEKAAKAGLWTLLGLCFAAGVGVSFTPCVLPMVPITMGIIGARSAGSKLEALSRAATYVAGLALVYTGLGVVAGVTGGMFGSWLQSPVVVIGIALLFVAMGAGMFGFFDIQLPSSVAGRLQGKGAGGGYAGAFVVGMVGALVAGPCSGPVVVGILGLITQGGQVWLGALLMAVFSLGMGMIFLVTGAASGWLPSRGPWMVVVKKSFGIIMWLGAIYYARSLMPDSVAALLTAFVLLSTAVYSWPSPEDGEGYALERLRQLYAIVGGLVGAYLLVGSLVRDGFILPPFQVSAAAGEAKATAGIQWLSDEETAVAQARATGKPLLIDFTAEWCAACHEMEKYTYTDPKVIAAADGFVPVMIDCTDKADPKVEALLKKYDVRGLPKVVFVSPEGAVLGHTQDFVPADQFLPKMQAALGREG